MSGRHRRTRIYGANYDIGESYYKKQLNELDNKAGCNRTAGVDSLSDVKHIPKVSFLSSDLDLDDYNSKSSLRNRSIDNFENGDNKALRRTDFKYLDDLEYSSSKPSLHNRSIDNCENGDHKTLHKIDYKYLDDFENELVKDIKTSAKQTSSILSSDVSRYRADSPDGIHRSLHKYSFEKAETPLDFEKKAVSSMSIRSKYVHDSILLKEKDGDDFKASHRANATKARLQDLEAEMSSLTNKQNEREKRKQNLKKILSSSSNNEVFE